MLVHPFLKLFTEPKPEEHDNKVPEHTNNGEATEQEDGSDADVEYKIDSIEEEHKETQQRAYGWWMSGGVCEGLGEKGGIAHTARANAAGVGCLLIH